QNFDGKFWGPLPIRRALGASRNIPAVKAFFLAGGEEPILQLAAHMGVTNPKIQKGEHEREEGKVFDYGWPLGIGAGETPLLEMVSGYSTLAGMGTSLPLTSIRRISDRNGNILFEAPQTQPEQVLDARIAYQITSILSDPEPRPNEYWRNILTLPGTEAAAKTGTSNKCLKREEKKDGREDGSCVERRPDNLWTIGYTPALVTGVWVGNASNEPLAEKAESLVTAAPNWKAFMTRALQHFPATQTQFTQPPDLLQPQISLLSGELPAKCTPVGLRRAELFLEENAPTTIDPACTEILIDRVTNLRASDSCPVEAREERSFLMPRSILSDRWPEWEKGVQEWAAAQMLLWNAAPDHSGSILPLPLAPTEDCNIANTPGRLEKPTLRITFPEEGGLVPYPSFRPQIDFTVGSRLHDLRFAVDGKFITSGSGSLRPVLTMPKSIKPSGTHTIEITVIDQYFNEVKKSVSFRFLEDHTPPSVRLTSPQENLTIHPGTEILLRATADDAEGGVKHVQFFLNDRLLSNDPLPPYELSYKADLKPGTYTLKARATDLAGNGAEDFAEVSVIP
ncbi:hypothetical protein HY464_01465, partial [Candidatus Peregrinibacteria bacterium]|nr:hypothetical protein [Candidatus Peregrinibacteria bacterium]